MCLVGSNQHSHFVVVSVLQAWQCQAGQMHSWLVFTTLSSCVRPLHSVYGFGAHGCRTADSALAATVQGNLADPHALAGFWFVLQVVDIGSDQGMSPWHDLSAAD